MTYLFLLANSVIALLMNLFFITAVFTHFSTEFTTLSVIQHIDGHRL